jgi:LuxR family maltose regulon positive regulatory protein
VRSPEAAVRTPRTKIAIPLLPPDFVPRPGLRERLDGAAATDLVIVSAPAGYGKTVVLADWARHHSDPVAWVTVDRMDDDPRRLWTAVRAALALDDRADGQDGQDHSGTDSTEGTDTATAVVDDVLAALDDLPHAVTLVLDDVQELSSAEVLHDLARLVRLRPPCLRIALASRVDPPLGLSRHRLEGRLREVRAADLRFSVDGAAALLRSSGLCLTRAQVEALCVRTDGWGAGLRPAAFALRRCGDADRFLADFSGDERSVADYLTGEVLAGLHDDILTFLRAVSVCSVLSAGLAVHLSGRSDAGALLEHVRQETALVERGGAGEYRLHGLLRSYLSAELRRRDPSRHDDLHSRAARRWAERAEASHALRHARRSDDQALLAELVHRFAPTLLLRGELDVLRASLQAAGPSLPADPEIALLSAVAHLERRDRAATAAQLQRARAAWPAAATPEAITLRAGVELLAAAAGVDIAVSEPPPMTPEGVSSVLLHLGRGAFLLRDPVARDRARTELEQVVALARRNDLPFLEVHGLTLVALAHALQGEISGVARCAADALAASSRRGRSTAPWTSAPAALLAYADLLQGRPQAAVERTAEALRRPELLPDVVFALHAVHAAGRADRGEGVAGLAEARAARMQHGDAAVPAECLAALAALEHRAAVLLGNAGAARTVAAWLEGRVGHVGEIALMQAWAEAAAGRHEAAAAAADPVLDGAVPVLLAQSHLEALLVRAEARLQAGRVVGGQAVLRTALAEGRALGIVRPFALAGPATRDLLGAWGQRPGNDRFTAAVGRALGVVHPEISAPLSDRETAVLELLPSLLSAREIAAELTVSVNTVKTHIRAIYGKLSVSSRRDAVLRARRRGLLP